MKELLYLLATDISAGQLPRAHASKGEVSNILEVVYGIVGSFAFLVIVLSGLRFITAGGDPEKATKARNGVIYALVGLVLTIMSGAIVAFVLSMLGNP